jgi:hypothetical protein
MVYLCCGLCQLAWLYWARESKIASPINLILRLGKAGMTWSWLSFSVFLHSLSPSQVIRLLCMASKKTDSEAARHLKNWAGPGTTSNQSQADCSVQDPKSPRFKGRGDGLYTSMGGEAFASRKVLTFWTLHLQTIYQCNR